MKSKIVQLSLFLVAPCAASGARVMLAFARSGTVLVALALVCSGVFARGAPVVDYDGVQIATASGKPTSEEVRNAITIAAKRQNWTVTETGRGKMQATLGVRNHSISIDIGYTAEHYSIRYLDSLNMQYDATGARPSIHPKYNAWVKNLMAGIDSQLNIEVLNRTETQGEPRPKADAPAAPRTPVRLGVAMTAVPAITSQVPGAVCLLCVAAAHSTMAALKNHLATLPTDDLVRLKADLAESLRKKGDVVIVIPEALDIGALPDFQGKTRSAAKKDFTSLREKYGIEKLLVVEIVRLGVTRTFANYVPTGDPRTVFNGVGYIVNLNDNMYETRTPVNIVKAAEGKWDEEAPKYPGMTNAYFQTLELVRERYLDAFGN